MLEKNGIYNVFSQTRNVFTHHNVTCGKSKQYTQFISRKVNSIIAIGRTVIY